MTSSSAKRSGPDSSRGHGRAVTSGRKGAVVNVASRLRDFAQTTPHRCAIAQHIGRNRDGGYRYSDWSFRELNDLTDRLAAGLIDIGVVPKTRLALFVPLSREFIALTFAILKTGAVVVLIDPGVGKQNVLRCLEEVRPDGFVAVSKVQAIRVLKRRLFQQARLNVTVGRRWFWKGMTYDQLWKCKSPLKAVRTQPDDPAAVIFTSGSTGPPKGVCYEHGMFDAQVEQIRDFYGIEPGEIDLPGFPLFGLFNAAMGVTTVIPDMDATRPADVNPENIIQHIRDRKVTQAFGSPAFWNRVGRHCDQHGVTLPTLKRGLAAGGPVPVRVLEQMQAALSAPGAELHTPYGATESLPVASIGSREVLEQTAPLTRKGAGTCVGRPFPGVDVRLVPITDEWIPTLDDASSLPPGEIGEIVVSSPAVTGEYFEDPEATALSKIAAPGDSPGWWHRIGDVGYFDSEGRLWYCGRKAHIVESPEGRLFPVRCEAIINEHPEVYRSALVGVGGRPAQRPVLIVEPEQGAYPGSSGEVRRLTAEIRALAAANEMTKCIQTVLFHPDLPVDPRHNVKINREQLAQWAGERLSKRSRSDGV